MNKHTYAKIVKDINNNYYKVIITNTFETGKWFGGIKEHKDEYEIPFVFKTADVAKDFVSMLPDAIKEVTIKQYRCGHCHLCYASYKTYKLTIGEFEIYIQWDDIAEEDAGFLTDKVHITPIKNVVKYFTNKIRPDSYRGGVYTDQSAELLTNVVKWLKDAKSQKDALHEEYNFELVQQ